MVSKEPEIVGVDFLPVLVVCLFGLIVFIWLLHLGGSINIGNFIRDNPGPAVRHSNITASSPARAAADRQLQAVACLCEEAIHYEGEHQHVEKLCHRQAVREAQRQESVAAPLAWLHSANSTIP